MQYKGSNVQIFLYLLFQDFFLIKRNKISNAIMKRYVETGPPWRAPFSSLKYWIVVPHL